MSTGNNVRTRSDRVAALKLEPSHWRRWIRQAGTMPVLVRLACAVMVALLMMVFMRGWVPPFSYRVGYIPSRAIITRVRFEIPDETKTAILREQKRRDFLCFYENRPKPIAQQRDELKEELFKLLNDKPLADLETIELKTLERFAPPDDANDATQKSITPEEALAAIRELFADDKQLEKFDRAIRTVLLPFEERGLLNTLGHPLADGNQRQIWVHQPGHPEEGVAVDVSAVRIIEATEDLSKRLREEFSRTYSTPKAEIVAKLLHNHLAPNLPTTLTYNESYSNDARTKAVEAVPTAQRNYFPGTDVIARGGRPLQQSDVDLLKAEHEAWLNQLPWSEKLIRMLAFGGMIAAMYLLAGLYIYFQFDRELLRDSGRFVRLMALVLVTGFLAQQAAADPWRAEIIPLLICAFTATIAYGRQFALVLLSTLTLVITIALGLGIDTLVCLSSAVCSSVLFLGRVRNRTRLIYVGLVSSLITAATTIGVGVMVGQTVDYVQATGSVSESPSMIAGLLQQLLIDAGHQGIFVVLASLLMTGLLPFVERLFQVQTDLSLLELGDTSHPLLRQLAQRAPGTFNHSINVAAIAEPAAECIGGNGLLTRVGAYFHDIGKMFKPAYFVENQNGGNRHDALQPAMSTLVIIAHVKDGSDLARQHRLPQPIIDFIEQHHGTTLVEYFYRQAAKKCESESNGEELSEQGFRYPGPKPQTLEAAVLMLSDAVESASRTLVEPTPTRLQNLVDDIAMKRLLDGQFDDCGLTLSQLGMVKKSLVKSLAANYHGRLKYPGQQTA